MLPQGQFLQKNQAWSFPLLLPSSNRLGLSLDVVTWEALDFVWFLKKCKCVNSKYWGLLKSDLHRLLPTCLCGNYSRYREHSSTMWWSKYSPTKHYFSAYPPPPWVLHFHQLWKRSHTPSSYRSAPVEVTPPPIFTIMNCQENVAQTVHLSSNRRKSEGTKFRLQQLVW